MASRCCPGEAIFSSAPAPLDGFRNRSLPNVPPAATTKTIERPSGDQTGHRRLPGPNVNLVGTPRCRSWSQTSELFGEVLTVMATCDSSGESARDSMACASIFVAVGLPVDRSIHVSVWLATCWCCDTPAPRCPMRRTPRIHKCALFHVLRDRHGSARRPECPGIERQRHESRLSPEQQRAGPRARRRWTYTARMRQTGDASAPAPSNDPT